MDASSLRSRLDAFRQQGDPLADAVIESVFAKGELAAVNGLLAGLMRNGQLPAPSLDPAVARYLAESEAPARRADRSLLLRGEELFAEHGPSCLASLFFASLPECYVARGISRVLGLSRRLEDGAQRRVFETAQMVVDVLSPGGLDPDGDGRGIRAAQRVRLMHAAMRHLVLATSRPAAAPAPARPNGPGLPSLLQAHAWDPALGVPINQEDLAYTLLTFSHVVPRSLVLMGIELSPADEAAYLATWNVVGEIMGVHPDLRPASPVRAAALFETIKARQAEATHDSSALMEALLDAAKSIGVGRIDHALPEAMARKLLDERTRALVGLSTHASLGVRVTEGVIGVVDALGSAAERVADRFAIGRELSAQVGLHVVEGLTRLPPRWERGLFEIPATLTSGWGTSASPGAGIADATPRPRSSGDGLRSTGASRPTGLDPRVKAPDSSQPPEA